MSSLGSSLRKQGVAFVRQALVIFGGFTPLTVLAMVEVLCPDWAPAARAWSAPAFWTFVPIAIIVAVYRVGREVAFAELRERRHLTVEARAELMRDLRGNAGIALDLRPDLAIVVAKCDEESAVFADELRASLEAAGWNVTICAVRAVPAETMIEVMVLDDERPESTDAILEALRLSGLPNRRRKVDPPLPGGGFVNIVVPKRR